MGRIITPNRYRFAIRRLYYRLRRLAYYGHQRFCPCCKAHLRVFLPFGVKQRPDAQCPSCGSLERHRLLLLYLQQQTSCFTAPQRILHVAPEPALTAILQTLPHVAYYTTDLMMNGVMVQTDLTHIAFPDSAFDLILCNHVLEHIPDDRQAMRELRRVLRRGGQAILQVPLDPQLEQTFEDAAITDPAERLRWFGQEDHVRLYGLDYPDRLREAGFEVHIDDFVRTLDPATVIHSGLDRNEYLYVCKHP